MYNYIVNPINKKKVKINTQLGRKILKKYVICNIIGGSSRCTKFHNNPIKCHVEKAENGDPCLYRRYKKGKGICYKRPTRLNKKTEYYRDRSRKGKLNKLFRDEGAKVLQRNFKRIKNKIVENKILNAKMNAKMNANMQNESLNNFEYCYCFNDPLKPSYIIKTGVPVSDSR